MKQPVYLRRVSGVSLMPAIRPGRLLIFIRWRRLRPGQLVLARVDGREVIKQAAGRQGNGWRLVGLLPGSADYQVPEAAILAVAIGLTGRRTELPPKSA